MNDVAFDATLEPSADDVARFNTYLNLADDQWEHVRESDGTNTIASEGGLIVHLVPSAGGRAFAWAAVGPTVPPELKAPIAGLCQYYARGFADTIGCRFFFDELGQPCIGCERALPGVGKLCETDACNSAPGDMDECEQCFDELLIDRQIEADELFGTLLDLVDKLCERANPAVGRLAAGGISLLYAVCIARDVLARESLDDESNTRSDTLWSFPEDSSPNSYLNCRAVRLRRHRDLSFVGTTFVGGRYCHLRVCRHEGGAVTATMCLPDSKGHNQRESVVSARTRLLGEHLVNEPESIWKYVYVSMSDGEVVIRKEWPVTIPTPADVDQFAHNAIGFIAEHGEEMLDAGDPDRHLRVLENSRHIGDLLDDAKEMRQSRACEWAASFHPSVSPIPSASPIPYDTNVYDEDEPF